MSHTKPTPIGGRLWTVFVIFGLIGQMAWTIENMYLNVYIYKTVTVDPDAIATMVAITAVIATLATLTMGAVTDRLGKRKLFINLGYIIWGISILGFGYITTDNVAVLFPGADVITATVALIITLDCLMTFIGSSSNDAAFNSWVTDVTVPTNRGRVEGLLATMPLLGMLVVFGGLDGFTQRGEWLQFFQVVGAIVIASGLIGMILIRDVPRTPTQGTAFAGFIHAFSPSHIKKNKLIYIVFSGIALLGIAQQVFLPYFIIYFEFFLGIENYVLLLGSILLFASLISIIAGRFIDRYGKRPFLVVSTVLYLIGMAVLWALGRTIGGLTPIAQLLNALAGIVMMGSYLTAMVVLNSMGRDLMPVEHIGVFSGVRMIFLVLIPMVAGPFIGSSIINASSSTYLDEFGILHSVPIPEIYLGGAIVGLLTFIPILYLVNVLKKGERTHD